MWSVSFSVLTDGVCFIFDVDIYCEFFYMLPKCEFACEYMHFYFFFFLAPYSFDKDTLFAILEKEKEKVTAKLEHFAQLLRESKVGNCNSV